MRLRLSSGWIRRAIIGGSLLALAVLAGCSALKLGYGQGPVLAHWWLDGYLDFDAGQSRRVKDELRRWFDWHQQTQLNAYALHLAKARAEAAQAVSGEQLCRWSDATRDLVVPAIERVLPAAAEIALGLTPAQLQQIDKRHVQRTRELREQMLQSDPEERRQAMIERTIKRFEGFYGPLGAAQRRLVEEGLAASPFDAQTWLAQREQRHREMLDQLAAIVRERPPAAVVEERLRQMLRRFDGRAPIAAAHEAAALAAHNCAFTARIHNSATAQQRRHLADKLRGWESDLRALAEQAQINLAGPAAGL
jgi:hypothetical protein